jgi:long-chain acyl-CoA synthetase
LVAFDPVVIDKRPRSLAHMFLEWVETTPDADAYYYPVDGGWQESTWEQTHQLVEPLAAGLVALGIQPEERVAVMATTRYEWVLAFLAVQFSGAAVTLVDPAASDAEVAQVLQDSGTRVVIAEDYEATRALWRIRARIRDVTKVVQIDGEYPDARVLSLEGLLGLGTELLESEPRIIARRMYAVRRQGLAAIVYEPADDGSLRGVRLTHSALSYQGAAIASLGLVGDPDLLYLCLPLDRTFGRTLLAAHLACGFPVALEGRPDRVLDSLTLVRPTVVGLTPAQLGEVRERAENEPRPRLLRRRAERRVVSGVREVFGDRLRFVVTAGAGLDAELIEFFALAGVNVVEAYGRPETGGAACVAQPGDSPGTAGRPLPGPDVRVAEDGEILVAGPGVMEGYHRRRTDTAAVLRQGWWHSGDTGALDGEGRLRVLGRQPARSDD